MNNASEPVPPHKSQSSLSEILAELEETKEALRRSETQRKHAENALKESRERYEAAITGFSSGLWDWNLLTNDIFFSPQTKQLMGYADHEIANDFREFKTRIHPQDHGRVLATIADYLAGRLPSYDIEFRLRHKDGFYRWVLSRGAAIRDAEGKPIRMSGSMIDITSKKRDEQVLRENQEKFQAIFEGTNDALFLFTERGVFECNRRALDMFGFSLKEEVLGMRPGSYAPVTQPDGRLSATVAHEHVQIAFQEGHSRFEFWHRRMNGQCFPAEVLLSAFEFCGERVLQASVHDITERKRIDEALRESDRRFASAFEHAAIGIVLVGVDGRWLKVNSAFCELIGYSQEELQEKNVRDITHPDDVEPGLALVRKMVTGEIHTYQLEKRYFHKNGQIIWVSLSVSSVLDDQGGVRYIIGQVLDITRRRHVEQNLRLTQFAIDHASDAIFWIASDARILNVNQAACLHLGYSREELLTARVFDFDPDFTTNAWDQAWKALIEKQSLTFETRHRTKDGRLIPVEININYVEFEGKIFDIAFVRDISQRKRAEEALRESNAELERRVEERTRELDKANENLRHSERFAYATLDALSAHICVLDEKGVIVAVNKSWRAHAEAEGMLSQNAGQGENYLKVCDAVSGTDAQWAQAFAEGIRAVIQGRRDDFCMEYACDTPGQSCWFFGQVTRFPGEGPFRAVVAHENITQRKLAEQELQKSRQKLTRILDQMPVGVAWANDDNQVEFANRKFFELFGCELSDIDTLEKWFALAYPDPDYRAKVMEAWCTQMTGSQADGVSAPGEYRVTRKDGSVGVFEITGRMVQGTLLAVFNDVTERKQNEELIRKLSRAIEQSPVSVIITDKNGAIEYVNPRFCEVTGYTVEEALGKNPRLLKSDYHTAEFYAQLWRTLISGGAWFGEFLNRNKYGVDYWERATISPIRDASGTTTHYVAVKENITEEKRVLAELKQAKEMAESTSLAKSAFLAHMSHEIRTPMNAILGFSQLMLRDPELTPRQRQSLDIVNRSGEHLLSLINDVLEMSKIEAGHATLNPCTFNFHMLLEDLEMMFRVRTDAKRLRFCIERIGNVPRYIVTDESKLRQVLINLLGNSVKFTERGSITMRVSVIRLQQPDLHLIFEVEDTGVGIAPAEIGKLFQRFEQTQSGRSVGSGTGLGLAISQEFVRLMGGKITVASEVGKKTTFWVKICIKEGEGESVIRRAANLPQVIRLAPGQSPIQVLIADNQEGDRSFLSDMLEAVGFKTRRAGDGLQALQQLEQWKPQLILMDLHMPVMDGIESIKQIRKIASPTVKIIVITASVFENDRKTSLETGADDFMAKPFREAELFQKIKTLLNVTFEYDPKDIPSTPPPVFDAALRKEALVKLPQTLVRQLYEATLNADLDQLLELTDQTSEYDTRLGNDLRGMAERFEYQNLLDLLIISGNDY